MKRQRNDSPTGERGAEDAQFMDENDETPTLAALLLLLVNARVRQQDCRKHGAWAVRVAHARVGIIVSGSAFAALEVCDQTAARLQVVDDGHL